jgi:alpha-beta hydrolase superfamily lysophospholipase
MVRNRIASRLATACAAGLVFLIAACAPLIAPRGVENDTPAFTDSYLLTRDGVKLPSRVWGPDHPKAVIVALHGMGDYSNFIALPAAHWAEHGIATLAFDQRGFGASPGPGLWSGGDAMRNDLADALAAARAKYPGVPVYVLGESMGGAVVLSALATADPPKPDGIILVAPAVWSRSDMPLLYRVTLWLAAHVAPGLHVSGNGVVHIWPSDNVPMLRAYSRDPLVQKDTRSDAVYGLVDLMDEARHAPEHIGATPPMLLLYGQHDQVIPAPPTEAVVAALGAKAQAHRYEHGYHMLLRDLEGPTIWQDIETWIEKGGKQ